MKPEVGVALGGRYRLVSRIAVGGMGEVWVGHDDALRRDVAVKVLREEFAGDSGFLERFRTEARNSARLTHPNIAALYDYGEQDGSGFLVMELVLGEPMSDLLDRQPVLPTRRLLPVLAQTARALHAAHVASVVHRDVKPGNILLSRSGQVKITDFGISTASNQVPMTASGMVMGTAQYLSPEQAMGRAATPASDIYSLGIVAYEGLVGNRPFTGATAVDIAIAHVNTPVPPLPRGIDPDLSALVMRMLDKDPERRPRSAASLARQLDALVDTTPSEGIAATSGRHARPVDIAHADEQADTAGRHTRSPGVPRTGPLHPAGATEPASDDPTGWEPRAETPAAPRTPAQPVTPVRPFAPAHPAAEAASSAEPDEAAPIPGDVARGTRSPDTAVPAAPEADGAPAAGPVAEPAVSLATGRAAPDPRRLDPPTTPSRPVPPPVLAPSSPVPHPGVPEHVPHGPGPAQAVPRTALSAGQTTPDEQATPPAGHAAPGTGRRPTAGPAGRDDRPEARGARTHRPRKPVSTTTGRRWRGLTSPLVALVLMLLFALLGAAFADRIWGPSRADAPATEVVPAAATPVQQQDGSPISPSQDGMIHARGPYGLTTTAKDQ